VPNLTDRLLEQLLAFAPAALYALIGVLASIENVFPPVPADTAVVLGAFLSNAGTISAWAVFGVTWTANVGGAVGVYVAARTIGRRFFTGRLGKRLLIPRHLERIERMYDRYGAWGIFLSRFVPGARAVIPLFSGVARLGSVRALVPLAVASAIWYGALTFAAARLLPRLDDVATFAMGLNWFGLGMLGTAVFGVGVWYLIRKIPPRERRQRIRQLEAAAAERLHLPGRDPESHDEEPDGR
jgi:membrane protein DedA with SNARE-associated domain